MSNCSAKIGAKHIKAYPEVMTACRNDGYRPFLDAVKGLFRELREIGVVIPP